MLDYLITDTIDLSKPPCREWAGTNQAGSSLTIGDLHGNALKLIHTLINYGILYHISDEAYLRLYDIYYSSFNELTKENLAEFLEILSSAKVKTDKFLRLLGDEVADRGCNDYLTLKVIEKLVENDVDMEIILSNHGVELIDAYLEKRDYKPSFILQKQTTSMLNMQKAINQGLVARQEVDNIISKWLIPNLKAIGFKLDKKNKTFEIYTHAPVGLIKIQQLSSSCNIYYSDKNISALKKTIKQINKHVRKKLRGVAFVGFHKDGSALNTFLWNRNVKNIYQPLKINQYALGFRHGHHNKGKSNRANVFNLDDMLGKAEKVNDEFRFNPKGIQRISVGERCQFKQHSYFYYLIYKNYLRLSQEAFSNYFYILNDGIFNINTFLYEKDTLLGMAIKEGHIEYAKTLIANGADIKRCSKMHIQNALDLARHCGEIHLAKWIAERENSTVKPEQSSTAFIQMALEVNALEYRKNDLELCVDDTVIENADLNIEVEKKTIESRNNRVDFGQYISLSKK